MQLSQQTISLGLIASIMLAVILVLGLMFGWPMYSVWQQGKKGEAELARAEYNKRIAIFEAQARLEAAEHLANAEVRRARGVAEANKIIGESLKGNEAYLRYLWIQSMTDTQQGHTVVYVPTEAGLPILEAQRFNQKQ